MVVVDRINPRAVASSAHAAVRCRMQIRRNPESMGGFQLVPRRLPRVQRPLKSFH